MMTPPKVAVLFGFGINCDHETAAVFNLVGGQSERIHVNHFVDGTQNLENFDILAVSSPEPILNHVLDELGH